MINYVIGNATAPKADGHKIIVHICNDIGGWGKGFVLALSKRWNAPECEYRDWYHKQGSLALGDVQLVDVQPDITVANMIAQHDIRTKNKIPPIRYDALRECLNRVCIDAQRLSASIHMPRIGCGLAGGTWDKIEPIILDELCSKNIDVYVYDFK